MNMHQTPNPFEGPDDPRKRVIHFQLTVEEAEALSDAASCLYCAAFEPSAVMGYFQDHHDPDAGSANAIVRDQALKAASAANRLDLVRDAVCADVKAWAAEQVRAMERLFADRDGGND